MFLDRLMLVQLSASSGEGTRRGDSKKHLCETRSSNHVVFPDVLIRL